MAERKRISRKNKASLTVTLIILLAIALLRLIHFAPGQGGHFSGDAPLRVHFIDVGQADCTLVELPDGKNMLIDAGNNDDGDDVVDYLTAQGIERIDILVGTHPHEDHIGGLDDVINEMDIGELYMPKVQNNTKTFQDVLKAAQNKGLKVKTAKKGVELASGDDLSIKMLAPVSDEYESLNNYSAVIRLVYGDVAFLFTGDAEEEAEAEIADDVGADVLKVGHHGSSSSTSDEFLARVNPTYAYIPCGKDNSYGHPHRETLEKLENLNVIIYRTDEDGTVVFGSDGKTVGVVES